MADSEASGEARVHDPVDGPVDTDRLTVDPSEGGEPPAADADFGYLFDDAAGDDGPGTETEAVPEPEWIEPPEPEDQTFDAFDENTWNFRPAPAPWYRTGPATAAVVAVSIAVVALIVSVVLLAFRGTSGGQPMFGTDGSIAPTSAASSTTTEVSEPPPEPSSPPPAPPPPSASASSIQRPPAPASEPPRPTRKPELNVTRSSMSASPQKPSR